MDNSTIKAILKTDLGISVSTEAYDNLIDNMIERARTAIGETGITIQDTNSDGMLIEQYAAWLLRKRKENAMFPKMLKHQLHNRLLSEKMSEPDEEE